MLATRPPYLAAIAAAALMLVPAAPRRVTPTHERTADEILAASREAQGGCARIRHLREQTMTGRVIDHESDEVATLTLSNQAPGDLRMVLTWPGDIDYQLDVKAGVVTIDQGIVDGVRDHQLVTGAEREHYLIDATFVCHPSAKALFRSSQLIGITSFEGTRAYQIEQTTASGLTSTTYIAVDTLLPIGAERDTVMHRAVWEPPGPPHFARMRWVSSDFRRVNGVLIPFESRQLTLSGDGFLPDNTLYVEHVAMQFD